MASVRKRIGKRGASWIPCFRQSPVLSYEIQDSKDTSNLSNFGYGEEIINSSSQST